MLSGRRAESHVTPVVIFQSRMMRMRSKGLALGLILTAVCAVWVWMQRGPMALAQDKSAAAMDAAGGGARKTEPWKPEDFIYSETAAQYRIAPDGKWLVWVKSAGDKEKDSRVSNLFLSSLTESREIQLTRGTDTYSQPKWSPDGEGIAFLSTRARPQGKPDNAKMQIWLINPRGGEPWPLTELVRAPRQIEWLDKDTLIFSAQEDPTLYEEELKKKKDARLREKSKELSGTAPLLKEAGSFHGQGKENEEPIYDLGGNVAEWVLTRDGKGKVIGGSAD